MFTKSAGIAAFVASLFTAGAALAQAPAPISPADLRRHIEMLASEAFEGRAPATAGEKKTIDYISSQLAARGIQPAAGNGSWFQPVRLVERQTRDHQVRFVSQGRDIAFDPANIALQGRDAEMRIQDAPVVFAGHGARLSDGRIDQLAGASLNGAIVLILFEGPDVQGFPDFAKRVRDVTEAGAAAVIAITGADIQWNFVARNYRTAATKLADQRVAPIVGAIPQAAAEALVSAAGGRLELLRDAQSASRFKAVPLALRATLAVDTAVRTYTSHNVVGRLPGSGSTGQSVLLLGHWDHLGLCRPEGEADRICNGAVDNASGIAAMLEIADRLAKGPRPVRDILFLATTAEEVGLLGAEYFAAHPVVPAPSIVAAVNLDTIAIHPAGEKVAVMGRGIPELDRVIDTTVAAAGRQLDPDDEAASFVQRQDGWALTRAGIPSIMVGGSFSNMERLNAFLFGGYHAPGDAVGPGLVLDGAAEDSNLTVTLMRRLADPAVFSRVSGGAR